MSDYIFLTDDKKHVFRAFTPAQIAGRPVLSRSELFAGPPVTSPYAFSIWGMFPLTEDEIAERLPNLKALFYAAGSVQYFARPFLNQGVRVFSAWMANAVPVAEFTAAQIVLANKGYFQLHRRYRHEGWDVAAAYADTFPGNFNTSVGLLGAGAIGKLVISLLKPYRLTVKVFDPFLKEEAAVALGVIKTDMDGIFSECQTISNHLANNADTQGIITGELFALMRDNATFINTGRGAQVDVSGLIAALTDKPGRTALLDVTDPEEPLPPGHPIWRLPNVFLTPHRAGSAANEIKRMGEYMFDAYARVLRGEDALYEVTPEMLAIMA